MKAFRKYLRTHWRLWGIIIIAALAVGFLLLYKLGPLTGGLSNGELRQMSFSESWHHLAANPLYLPITLVQWVFLTISAQHTATTIRLASVVFGLLSLCSFAYVLRRWYGVRTAIYGSIIFVSSGWFLHVSRLGTVEIAYLWAVPTLIAVQIAWERHSHKPRATFLAVLLMAILLYVPGMLWLILISIGLQHRHVLDGWQKLKNIRQRFALPVMFAAVLMPLIIAAARTPSLVQTWLGLPKTFGSADDMLARLGHALTYLFWHGPADPQLWLGSLAVLNIFTIAMTIGGILFYAAHYRAPRTRLLFGLFIVSIIFFALNGPVGYSAIMPLIYFLVAAGVGHVLHEWLRVFPRNPLARGIGFGLLSLVVALSCLYNLRSYFIAWPHNQATRATFHNRL